MRTIRSYPTLAIQCGDDDLEDDECNSTISVIQPVGPMYRPVMADVDNR